VGIGTNIQPDSKTFFSVYQPTLNSNIRVASGSSGAFSSIQMLSGGTHWELGTQGTFANGNLIIRPSSSGNSDMFNFANTGRFGIGTTTPQNELNVIGDGNFTGNVHGSFVGDGSQITNLNLTGVNGSTQWKDNGNDIYYDEGNVGIGTDSISAALTVFSNSGDVIHVQRNGQSLFNLGAGSLSGTDYLRWGKGGIPTLTIGENNAILIGTNVGIDELSAGDLGVSGKVGIGTTTPTQKLDVNGSANVENNITISGMVVYKDTNGDMVFRA